jgi:hypothetical protein
MYRPPPRGGVVLLVWGAAALVIFVNLLVVVVSDLWGSTRGVTARAQSILIVRPIRIRFDGRFVVDCVGIDVAHGGVQRAGVGLRAGRGDGGVVLIVGEQQVLFNDFPSADAAVL